MARPTSNPSGPRDIAQIADDLAALYGEAFGGKTNGKFRISRKFLRQVCGRRHLPSAFLEAITDELFERGFVLIDLETHFAVISQPNFNSYRRVTTAAVAKVLGEGESVVQ